MKPSMKQLVKRQASLKKKLAGNTVKIKRLQSTNKDLRVCLADTKKEIEEAACAASPKKSKK